MDSKMKRAAAFLFAFLLSVCGFAAPAFAVDAIAIANAIVNQRPRLLFQTTAWPAGISPEQVAKRVDLPPWNAWYARLDADNFHTGALSWLIRNRRGETDGRDAVADSVLARMLALPVREGIFHNGENLQRMSLAYDWLYDYEGFSAEMKDSLREKMFAMAENLLTRDRETGEVYFGPEIFHNYFSNGALAIGLTGLATYRGFGDTQATRLIRMAMDWYSRAFVGMRLLEGGWHEGMAYSLNHVIQETPIWAAALRSATGADIFARIKRDQGNWMEGWIYFCLSALQPDWTFVPIGDNPAPRLLPDYTLRQALEITVSAYRNSHGRFLLDEIESRLGERSLSPGDLWMPLIFHDPTIPPRDYRELNPSQFIGPARLGYATLRSGWGADDTFIHFKCGDYFGSHNHLDQNQFTIYHKGALALDAGYYDSYSPHHEKYATRSIAHNTVLVKDPGEKVPSRRYETYPSMGGQRALDYYFRNSNRDIGQYWSQYRSGAWADVGDMTAGESRARYDYVAGDATAAYNSTVVTDPGARPKISRFVRRLLFVKPDLVAVFDNVDSTAPEFLKTWLLHTVNEPVISADGSITVEEGEGRLHLSALYPEDVRAVKVGGPGMEFVVNGENLPLVNKSYFGPPAEPGAWRLELSPAASRTQDIFLNLMQLGDRGTSPSLRFSRTGSPDLAGGVADTLAILFTRDRDPRAGPARILILPEGLPAGCTVYLAGVEKRGIYRLKSAGERVTTLSAREGGVLVFRLERPERATLENVR